MKTPEEKKDSFQAELEKILRLHGIRAYLGEPSDMSSEQAQEAITKLIDTDIIGEDLPLNTEPNTGQCIHNKVKQEQRDKLRG